MNAPAPSRSLSRWHFVGPGIIWAMTAVGQTHVVLSTYAGTRFGFELLWMVLLAHLMAYPVFEYGARYSVATGESLLHAYFQMRGVRWVMVPFLFASFAVLSPLLFASMGGVAAAVLFAAFPGFGFMGWVVVLAIATIGLILSGRYGWLERLNIGMAALLLVGILLAFALSPPNISEFSAGLVPHVPDAALLTLVALMRLPSDAVTSLLLSTWALQHAEESGTDDRVETLHGILFGFRVGYALSLVVAVVFLSLGATVLGPRGVSLEGVDLALQLSLVFTETVGAWTFPLFILIAFVSLYAGYYAAAQATPLIFVDLVRRVWPSVTKRVSLLKWIPNMHLLFCVGGGAVIAVGVESPAFLVVLSVSLGLIGLPLYLGLNFFAVTNLIEPEFRPGWPSRALAVCGMIFSIVGVCLFVQTRLLS